MPGAYTEFDPAEIIDIQRIAQDVFGPNAGQPRSGNQAPPRGPQASRQRTQEVSQTRQKAWRPRRAPWMEPVFDPDDLRAPYQRAQTRAQWREWSERNRERLGEAGYAPGGAAGRARGLFGRAMGPITRLPVVGPLLYQARLLSMARMGPVAALTVSAYVGLKAAEAISEPAKAAFAARFPGTGDVMGWGEQMKTFAGRVAAREAAVTGAKGAASKYTSTLLRHAAGMAMGRMPVNAHEFAAIEARRELSAGGWNEDLRAVMVKQESLTQFDLSPTGRLQFGWKRASLHGG